MASTVSTSPYSAGRGWVQKWERSIALEASAGTYLDHAIIALGLRNVPHHTMGEVHW